MVPKTERTESAAPAIGRGGKAFVVFWAASILAAYAAAGYFLAAALHESKVESAARHVERVDEAVPDADGRAPQAPPPPGTGAAAPTTVRVGVYIDRISAYSVRESYWKAEFFIWFRWRGEVVNPGATFQIIDGDLKSCEIIEDDVVNGEHYQLYLCTARITKFFEVTRFPRDDHVLTVEVEDAEWDANHLRYVADAADSRLSARVRLPGYRVYRSGPAVKTHVYPSAYGDPRLVAGTATTYSRFVYGVWVTRLGWGYFYKIFLGLFVAVAVSLVAFYVRPTDGPRFALGIGALFAAVANNYISNAILPDMGTLTLTDMINSLGIVTIFLTLLQSTISLYFYDHRGKRELSRLFDRVSFAACVVGYVACNVALPLAASL